MIKLRLTRDEARLIDDYWLPFMIKLVWSNLRTNAGNHGKYLNCKILLSLLCDVQMSLKRKLLTSKNQFSLSLTEAEASAFYVYLMKQPIDACFVYAVNMRQSMCNHLHKELFADTPPVFDAAPFSMADLYEEYFEE